MHQNIFTIFTCFSSSTWLFLLCYIHTRWVLQHVNKWMHDSIHSLTITQQSMLRLENLPSRLESFMEDADSVFGRENTEISFNESQFDSKAPSRRLDLEIAAETQSNTIKNAGKHNKKKRDYNPVRKGDVIEVLDNEVNTNTIQC